jgi:hypothetical protein
VSISKVSSSERPSPTIPVRVDHPHEGAAALETCEQDAIAADAEVAVAELRGELGGDLRKACLLYDQEVVPETFVLRESVRHRSGLPRGGARSSSVHCGLRCVGCWGGAQGAVAKRANRC